MPGRDWQEDWELCQRAELPTWCSKLAYTAKEALPYWLQRVRELEEELEKVKAQRDALDRALLRYEKEEVRKIVKEFSTGEGGVKVMSERDWQKDWELCQKATPGPWYLKGLNIETKQGREIAICRPDPMFWATFTSLDSEILSHIKDDAKFIAEAREALPYWLRRVRELEEQVSAIADESGKSPDDFD